ncbi:MAG: ATP synthase subunit I [Candidatus Hydrogenedentes bacterium]|nr:ATP synthase subunit I [Candidatus Hydrogenedentota bacterium]
MLEGVKRLRRIIVASAAALALLAAAVPALWDPPAAAGLLLGAAAGILPFWAFGRRVEHLAPPSAQTVDLLSARWSLFRITLGIVALLLGYSLEPVRMHGLLGALAGLFILRIVVLALALTGLDLKLGKSK